MGIAWGFNPRGEWGSGGERIIAQQLFNSFSSPASLASPHSGKGGITPPLPIPYSPISCGKY
ncbi:MAG: hypothetical protein DSM106950_28400 [Stigonema ocellatum SAG 48.90 = DSM 106950]|nr:hypothetical protein [Stigonema ocellatum SAG 48.90 = DSM 106950]